MKSWEQLLPPVISQVLKIQRQSSNPTITHLRRQNSLPHSFHLGFLSETECPPFSLLEHKSCMSTKLSDNFCVMDMPKATTLESKRIWCLQSLCCLVPCAFMRTTTISLSLFATFQKDGCGCFHLS
jgi:hypothetical protein